MLLGSLKIIFKFRSMKIIWEIFDRLSWAFAQCEENWFVFGSSFLDHLLGSSAVWVIFIILDNRGLLRNQVSVRVLVTVVIFYSFFAQPITEVEWPWLHHFRCWKNSFKSRNFVSLTLTVSVFENFSDGTLIILNLLCFLLLITNENYRNLSQNLIKTIQYSNIPFLRNEFLKIFFSIK